MDWKKTLNIELLGELPIYVSPPGTTEVAIVWRLVVKIEPTM